MAQLKTLSLTLLAITLALAQGCIKSSDNPKIENYVKVGDMLPSFTAEGPHGEFTSPFEKGKRGLIVLFTVSCPSCTKILPELNKLWQEYDNGEIADFEFVMINRGESAKSISDYWIKHNFEMEYYYDFDRKIYNMFANAYVPRLYLVGRDGKVVKIWVEDSNITSEGMKKEIEKLK